MLSRSPVARGFFTQDESRASRYILKDYVNAKLLYCHPPPGVDPDEFNAEARDIVKLALASKLRTKRAPTTRVGRQADTFIALPEEGESEEDEDEAGASRPAGLSSVRGPVSVASLNTAATGSGRTRQSARASALDRNFFADGGASSRAFVNGVAANSAGAGATTRGALYPHQRQLADDGKKLSSRKMRELEALGAVPLAGSSKKHNKGNKIAKQRSGDGYEF